MVRDINSLGGTHNTRAQPSGNKPVAPQGDNQAAPEATATSKQRAEVQLSNQAQKLQQMESKLQDVPEVNEARVAAIKQALEEGNYKIDDLVVADKLIQADGLFS